MDLLRTGPVSYSSAFSTFGEKREGGRGRRRGERSEGRRGEGRRERKGKAKEGGKGREREGDRLGGKGEKGKVTGWGESERKGRRETKEESIAIYIINFPPVQRLGPNSLIISSHRLPAQIFWVHGRCKVYPR